MAAADLNSVLWRERELLESLLFHLETEQLLLSAGRSRWLAHASAEIDRTTATLRQTEILRAVEADRVAAELGLGTDASLSALARGASEPWRTIFHEQRKALIHVTTQITEMASANRTQLAAGQRATRAALLALTTTVQPDTAAAAQAPVLLMERTG